MEAFQEFPTSRRPRIVPPASPAAPAATPPARAARPVRPITGSADPAARQTDRARAARATAATDQAPPARNGATAPRNGATATPKGAGATDGRRTVTIRGYGAERNLPMARPTLRRHERAGFRPDRTALWAVLLGLLLIFVAAASAHAAVVHQLVR